MGGPSSKKTKLKIRRVVEKLKLSEETISALSDGRLLEINIAIAISKRKEIDLPVDEDIPVEIADYLDKDPFSERDSVESNLRLSEDQKERLKSLGEDEIDENRLNALIPTKLENEGFSMDELDGMIHAGHDLYLLKLMERPNPDPDFRPDNLLFGTSHNGTEIGSIYFETGRIRLVHRDGPFMSFREADKTVEHYLLDKREQNSFNTLYGSFSWKLMEKEEALSEALVRFDKLIKSEEVSDKAKQKAIEAFNAVLSLFEQDGQIRSDQDEDASNALKTLKALLEEGAEVFTEGTEKFTEGEEAFRKAVKAYKAIGKETLAINRIIYEYMIGKMGMKPLEEENYNKTGALLEVFFSSRGKVTFHISRGYPVTGLPGLRQVDINCLCNIALLPSKDFSVQQKNNILKRTMAAHPRLKSIKTSSK